MYEDIKDKFSRVISYSQEIDNPQIDNLFKRWEESKSRFIDIFGGLIYEYPIPVEFTLDKKEKEKRVYDLADKIADWFHNYDLAEFLDANADTFFDNTVSKSGKKNVPQGMKLIKAFKFFEGDKTTLHELQDLASQLIQESKISGTLCFSVHPLDFLSSSMNTYNWRSCHALDGEYRAGNLSYMVDDCTFMVYLRGNDKEVELPLFGDVKWNSKKWRMLIHENVNSTLLFAGRQYPLSSKSGIDQVLQIYNELTSKYVNISPFFEGYPSWKTDYIDSYQQEDQPTPLKLSSRYLVLKRKLFDIRDLVKDKPLSLNFNDILNSNCYAHPYFTSKIPSYFMRLSDDDIINIGGEVNCLHCGQEVIKNTETMRCDNCELIYGHELNDYYGQCACCGARIYIDDAPTVGDNEELVCDSCYRLETFTCDGCGEIYFLEDKHYISDSQTSESWVCPHCYNGYLDNKY